MLSVYFLVDVSESMVGNPIRQLEQGLAAVIRKLKADRAVAKTVGLSIVVFAGQAKTMVPLVEVGSAYLPKLPLGRGTSLSKGLDHLSYALRENTNPIMGEQQKPIVFLITDGAPTNNASEAVAEWKQVWSDSVNVVAVSLGKGPDLSLLAKLTENVFQLKDTTVNAYKKLFDWVSDTIKVNSGSGGFELASVAEQWLQKVEATETSGADIDEGCVVLTGKCQRTGEEYLIKYLKTGGSAKEHALSGISGKTYKLVGGFRVDNTFFELSDHTMGTTPIDSKELVGFPTCPCCENQIGFARCSCGKIHCIGDEPASTCPWCGNRGEYGLGRVGFEAL